MDEFLGLQLADPTFFIAAPIAIRLGCDVYREIKRNGVFGGTVANRCPSFRFSACIRIIYKYATYRFES